MIIVFLLIMVMGSLSFVTGACFRKGRCGRNSTSNTSSNVRGQAIVESDAEGNGSIDLDSPSPSSRTSSSDSPSPAPAYAVPSAAPSVLNQFPSPTRAKPNRPDLETQSIPSSSATRKPSTRITAPFEDTSRPTFRFPTGTLTLQPSTLAPSADPLYSPNPASKPAPVRINVGSNNPLIDSQGVRWQADGLSIGTQYQDDNCSGSIYCSNRWFSDYNSDNMVGSYQIDIPVPSAGSYRVRLHFAELVSAWQFFFYP